MTIYTRKVNSLLICLILFFLITPLQSVYAQWQYVGALHARVVRSITFVDARTSIIVGGVQSTNMAARYTEQGANLDSYFDTDTTLSRYTDVVFPERTNIGYTVGWDGAILKTTNIGNSWFFLTRYLPTTVAAQNFNGVYFVNNYEGYVVGGKGDTSQIIIKTIDGGNTWSVQRNTVGATLNSVYFTSASTGFAIGNKGVILKTTNGGLNWSPISLSGVINTRNFNKILFNKQGVGFIVGGNESDTIATILKSTDGGNTWTVVKDAINSPVLNGISFKNNNEAYIVGNQGVILHSFDAGNTWSAITLPDEINDTIRNLRTVCFFNDYTGGFGGDNGKYFVYRATLPQAPSVTTQNAVVNTTNNTVLLSGTVNTYNQKAWLSVEYGTTNALGTVLPVLADSLSNNTFGNVSVTTPALSPGFYYYRFRASGPGGDSVGTIKVFTIGVPYVVTGSATIDPTNKVKLSGTVNPSGGTATVTFEYGTTDSLGTVVNAIGTFSGYSTQNVSIVTPPLADGIYYYRIKGTNSTGTHVGTIRQFYVGPNPISNFDFEFWHTDTTLSPQSWVSMGGSRVTSYDGSFAVKIDGTGNNEGFGLALLGAVNDHGPTGGFPLNARPDSIVGYFNYNVVAGAPALFAVVLKKNGEMVDMMPNYIGISGNLSSNGQFERMAFPITYPNNTIIPDSAILILLTSDVLFGGGNINPSNWIEADNIAFIGTGVPIPNGNFEVWDMLTRSNLISWQTSNDENISMPPRVTKTTDAQHGVFAVKLKNDVSSNGACYLRLNPNQKNGWGPTISVTQKYAALQGYYKYFPEGGDSASINILMFKGGNQIGNGTYYFTPAAEYTSFSDTIQYFNWGGVDAGTPDSAYIEVNTIINNRSNVTVKGNSVLYLDNLSFDSYNTEDTLTITNIKKPGISNNILKIYPNPANDFIAIELPKNEIIQNILVFDLSGKTVQLDNIENSYQVQMLNVSNLATGAYLVRIQTDKELYMNKFIKQ